ncbi:uncharacterized protein LOC112142132 isoform X2 [Oryzias melastigma]|uniref:uncharacterized protein LOC112142132 isoform X2 n=1 Tax=Oryzias melastigma TaxID=30732 RepID=UPI00168CEBB9|nr:uncharacterized protein LOC112142132 isoform X2 [Oryzias melastigma]
MFSNQPAFEAPYWPNTPDPGNQQQITQRWASIVPKVRRVRLRSAVTVLSSGAASWRASGPQRFHRTRSCGQQSHQICPDFTLHGHFHQLFWGDPKVFQASGTCPEHLSREVSRRHPDLMPEAPQLAPLHVEEKRLYSELSPGFIFWGEYNEVPGRPKHPCGLFQKDERVLQLLEISHRTPRSGRDGSRSDRDQNGIKSGGPEPTCWRTTERHLYGREPAENRPGENGLLIASSA